MNTILSLMEAAPDEAPALSAPGRTALTFGALRALAARTVADLNRIGVGRGDRVAIVLPNGPEMAAGFIAIASACASAPLNPAYRADEFEFYLNDLGARALVVERGSASPAREVAQRLGVAVVELVPEPESGAGGFRLDVQAHAGMGAGAAAGMGAAAGADAGLGADAGMRTGAATDANAGTDAKPAAAREPGPAQPDDVALVLHTSGTTSRPKIVPLTQRNLHASARSIAATLGFSASDRGLNIMPLFHIHGLVAGILAPLSAGSQVCCTPGFDALKFFGWMDEARPTWYTAVPTMHQAILSRAARNAEVIARSPLRFIRSSSSSLPPQVLAQLEETFGTTVVEAYGMTEAAHQMASNPLPPGRRKPGSVGFAAGPEVAIMGEDGSLLPAGGVGEIVIRGDSVTRGYESNPKANAEAFRNGWFRTGDQGMFDGEGYLSLTGRLKEIINRGGEKISPREIDEVLMDHPAVAQVVTFAVPHDKLGEDVAAAVVLREGASASDRELREFAATRVADYKVPRKILILDEIPKGATGKLQRIGLAQKLGLA